MTPCGAVDGLIGCEQEALALSIVLCSTFQQSLLQLELCSVCKNTSPRNLVIDGDKLFYSFGIDASKD